MGRTTEAGSVRRRRLDAAGAGGQSAGCTAPSRRAAGAHAGPRGAEPACPDRGRLPTRRLCAAGMARQAARGGGKTRAAPHGRRGF